MKLKKYLAFDIGCIECGEESRPIGLFNSKEEAEKSIKQYITNEPNEFGFEFNSKEEAEKSIKQYITNETNENGFSWGRKEWTGQHNCEVFEIEI